MRDKGNVVRVGVEKILEAECYPTCLLLVLFPPNHETHE